MIGKSYRIIRFRGFRGIDVLHCYRPVGTASFHHMDSVMPLFYHHLISYLLRKLQERRRRSFICSSSTRKGPQPAPQYYMQES